MARRQRLEARRALRAQTEGLEEVRVRLRGSALEARRRLRPVFGPVGGVVSWIAPYISGALLFLVRLLGALIALVLEIGQALILWIAVLGSDAARATYRFLRRELTPLRSAAGVGIAAAVALGASQFVDYHGVAVDASAYAGEIGATAPVPITDRQSAGSAHLWILLPVAAVALALVVATYLGRARFADGVAICGLLGIAVAFAIDLPQGLDEGRPGIAFSGSEAQLLEGFWVEVSASAVLILSGGLLAHYSRDVRRERRGRRRARQATGRERSRADVRRVSAGLQES